VTTRPLDRGSCARCKSEESIGRTRMQISRLSDPEQPFEYMVLFRCKNLMHDGEPRPPPGWPLFRAACRRRNSFHHIWGAPDEPLSDCYPLHWAAGHARSVASHSFVPYFHSQEIALAT